MLNKLLSSSTKEVVTFCKNRQPNVSKESCWLWKDKPGQVCIVAHLDTVHDSPKKRVFHDSNHGAFWSPDGLGADDRAGVFGAFHLRDSLPPEIRPAVLITDGEEQGGWGAWEAVAKLSNELSDVSCFIQLDRRGFREAVFYDVETSKEFRDFILGFGLTKESGSFSDISILGPNLGIAAVNLSVGYQNEHTRSEWLNVLHLTKMLNIVSTIIRSSQASQLWRVPERRSSFYRDDILFPYNWRNQQGEEDWLSSEYEERVCDVCESQPGTLALEGMKLCNDCHAYFSRTLIKGGDTVDDSINSRIGSFYPARSSENKHLARQRNTKRRGKKVGFHRDFNSF